MVIGLLTLAAIPTTIGVAEGVNAEDKDNDAEASSKAEAERMRKFNLECYCESNSRKAKEIHGGKVVLRNDKIYIEPQSSSAGHTFEGFYISYPDPDRPQPPSLGLVSSIPSDPPTLNWIYVDKDTREVKYGNRTRSRAHIVGSWGWDAGEEGGPGGLTLEGKEGAVAVETEDGWEVRWEDENGEIGVKGKKQLTVSLERQMLDSTEEKKEEGANEKRTDSSFTLTNTTFKSNKTTNGKPEKGLKATIEKSTPKSMGPGLEVNSTLIEKPLKGE